MQNFRTVPDIRIEAGGAAKLGVHIDGLCANKRICIVTDKGVSRLGPDRCWNRKPRRRWLRRHGI